MKTQIKWTKTFDTGKCKCYEPDVKGLSFIWYYQFRGYEVGRGKDQIRFSTLKEAKDFVAKSVK